LNTHFNLCSRLAYRTRAAAGKGSACGLGASPAPAPRESARAAPRARKCRRAARLGCNGAQWSPGVRQQQPLTTGFVRGHPGSSYDQQPTGPPRHPPQMHTYMCKRSREAISPTCFPSPDQPPQSSNYELDRPGCDTHPLRRDMSFATGVDEVVLARCSTIHDTKKKN
jgi:hypothetical protein